MSLVLGQRLPQLGKPEGFRARPGKFAYSHRKTDDWTLTSESAMRAKLRLARASRHLLGDQVTMTVRAAIIQGTLPPGTRLVEEDLAESLQVSRGPVREALRRLEQEGLVQIVPAGGAFVSAMTEEDIAEIYGLRAVLEGYAARLVCNSRTEDLGRLESFVSQMHQASRTRNLDAVIEADLGVHRTLVSLAHNRRLMSCWEDLEGQIRLILFVTRDRVYRDLQGLAERHGALLEILRSGDGVLAEMQIRAHIEEPIEERQMYWREVVARRLVQEMT